MNKLLDLSHLGLVKISGENAEQFLQGQVTCDVLLATDDNLILGAICNHQGRVLSVFYLFKNNHDFYCIVNKDLINEFVSHLRKYAVFSRVMVTEATDEYRLYGWIGDNLPEMISELPLQSFKINGELTRYILISQEQLGHKSEQNNELWSYINILSGVPTLYAATAWKVTPHMLNLPHLAAISFNKGCYVGQEIIARTEYLGKSKRHLYRAKVTDALAMNPGTIIYSDSQEAGLVLDAACFQLTTCLVLVVLQSPMDREFLLNGQRLVEIIRC